LARLAADELDVVVFVRRDGLRQRRQLGRVRLVDVVDGGVGAGGVGAAHLRCRRRRDGGAASLAA
jgi:hypothetical protein